MIVTVFSCAASAERYLEVLKGYLIRNTLSLSVQSPDPAYLGILLGYGQNIFDRYVTYADFWIQDQNTAIRTPGSCLTVNR